MADVIRLPTAAAQPVVNPKRMGRRARGGKVTLASDLANRRNRKACDERAPRPAGSSAMAEGLRLALGALVECGSRGLSEAAMRLLYDSTKQLLSELHAKEQSHG